MLFLGLVVGNLLIWSTYWLATRKKRNAERAVIEAAKDMFRGGVTGDFHNLRQAVKNLDRIMGTITCI
jgi:hypothetical protein